MKKKLQGGLLVTAGYILSPLSWWNDLFINIPIAWVFAFPFGFIHQKLFVPMLILGYWVTNIAGFMMMHYGVKKGFISPVQEGYKTDSEDNQKPVYTKRDFIKDFTISVLYTLVVIFFVQMGWLKFPLKY
jgi:hypothetical protein